MDYTPPRIADAGSFVELTQAKDIGSPADGQFTTGPFGDQFPLTGSS